MATITLNVVSATLYESDSKQYPGTKIKRKLIALKEDARKLTIFRNAANGANFDLIFAGSTLTLDDQSFELNNYTNKAGEVVESLQLKHGVVFLVSGGTPPAPVQPTAPTIQGITIGQTQPPASQGVKIGQSTAPQQEQLSAKDLRIQQQADKRDAIMERQIAAMDRLALAIEKMNFGYQKPTPEYPDYAEKKDEGPSVEEMQALYDEEGY